MESHFGKVICMLLLQSGEEILPENVSVSTVFQMDVLRRNNAIYSNELQSL